jgi:hypothetical protein
MEYFAVKQGGLTGNKQTRFDPDLRLTLTQKL